MGRSKKVSERAAADDAKYFSLAKSEISLRPGDVEEQTLVDIALGQDEARFEIKRHDRD